MNQEENSKKTNELQPIYMVPPDWYHGQDADDEIDLLSLIAVLWQRKKLIIGVVVGLTVLAAVLVTFVMTPRYRIKALISPGIIGFNEAGQPLQAASPSDLQQWLTDGGYMDDMISRLSPEALEKGLIPGPNSIKVNVPGNGQIMTVSLYSPAPEQAKQSLDMILEIMTQKQSSYEHAKTNLEKNMAVLSEQLENWDIQQTRYFVGVGKFTRELELMKKDLERLQTSHQVAIEVMTGEIQIMEKDLERLEKIIDSQTVASKRLLVKIEEVNTNTSTIRELRNGIADTEENEMVLLMYANIIQQNLDNAVRLEERRDQLLQDIIDKEHLYDVKLKMVANKKLELGELKEQQRLEQQNLKQTISNKEWELDDLKENKSRELEVQKKELSRQLDVLKFQVSQLTPLQIVQSPLSSNDPVKPDKVKIVALAGVMGMFLGIFLAFMVEFYVRNKDRLTHG